MHFFLLRTNSLRGNDCTLGYLSIGHAGNWNSGVFRITLAYLMEIYGELGSAIKSIKTGNTYLGFHCTSSPSMYRLVGRRH